MFQSILSKYKITVLFLITCLCSSYLYAKVAVSVNDQQLFFIENKGQINDQNGNSRDDIQFSVRGNGINIFIGNGSIHYEFYKKEKTEDRTTMSRLHQKDANVPPPARIETYRMDVALVNGDQNAQVIPEQVQSYYENYFIPGCALAGEQAHTYKKITYKNIYPNIDWVLYIKNNKLEQEFVVQPGGDASMIKLEYNGQTNLNVNEDGSLTATTPMGTIKEQAPTCNLFNSSKVNIAYRLRKNILSYNSGDYDQSLVIDPILEWGTYYGPDSSSSPLNCVVTDNNANIYACGLTYASSDIATTGSFQTVFGGNVNAYLAKFDSSGNLLWATYYGGNGLDAASNLVCDNYGNIYMGGSTTSTDSLNIATPGTQQTSLGSLTSGAANGFLVKFNSSGSRIWGTYYGGDQQDVIYSVNCDNSDHIFIAGSATSSFNIASPGAFETVFYNPGAQNVAGFLAQFDTSGTRLWGTYYLAYTDTTNVDLFQVLSCTDGSNVYISGWTGGTDSITTPGTWQSNYGGGSSDAILVKFSNSGSRLWGTYYGGAAQDVTGSIACDKNGDIYMLGSTSSDTGIASPGCYQPTRGGGVDAFLAAFTSETGARLWGTYYGGPADENTASSYISPVISDAIYITGYTESTSGIASPGAWQTIFGGGSYDAFLAAYSISGSQMWSTYYGGSGDDFGFAATTDGTGVYVCGKTNSPNQIATHGSLDSTYSSGYFYSKGFLSKFAAGGCAGFPVAAFTDTGSESKVFSYTGTAVGLDSVIWNFGDGVSDTGIIAAHTYTASGTYTVCVTAYTSCGSDSICTSVSTAPAGIQNIAASTGVILFPNPAMEELTVAHAEIGTDIKLFSNVGQYVYGCTVTSDQQVLNIGMLSPGNYILQMTGVDGTRVNKIVTKE